MRLPLVSKVMVSASFLIDLLPPLPSQGRLTFFVIATPPRYFVPTGRGEHPRGAHREINATVL